MALVAAENTREENSVERREEKKIEGRERRGGVSDDVGVAGGDDVVR